MKFVSGKDRSSRKGRAEQFAGIRGSIEREGERASEGDHSCRACRSTSTMPSAVSTQESANRNALR